MQNLESILEIITAIRMQKKSRKESIPEAVKDLFKMQKSSSDISSIIKGDVIDESDSLNKMNEELFEKRQEKTYGFFQQFSEYITKVKEKLYGYYSTIKGRLKEVKEGFKVGYTDKLLKEVEDWGVIYFKTVFENLKRLSPLGSAYRKLQRDWICISKKIK
mgnify:CR=1 FL=1|jgi:hypothetical protein|tara:strand:- start:1030 stop:1512 length:483 start_codon:yes stop_codon:yes gene_type:complete